MRIGDEIRGDSFGKGVYYRSLLPEFGIAQYCRQDGLFGEMT